jgi:futalosine hydrolase
MEILLVCAVSAEANLLRSRVSNLISRGREEHFFRASNKVRLLTTGIGMVNAARQVSLAIARQRPDCALQFGVAGSFDPAVSLESLVQVRHDTFAELGADSPQGFLPLREIGFPAFQLNQQPVYNQMDNPHPSLAGLSEVRGITVHTVSGSTPLIEEMRSRWQPQTESMEGAAFFQVCLEEEVPFHQVRAISNWVEPRNRAAWRMKEASEAAQNWVWEWLSSMEQQRP